MEQGRMKFDGSKKLNGVFDEEFVLADSEDEARFVNSRLNAGEAGAAKRRRMEHLRAKGEVNEVLMPDTFAALSELASNWWKLSPEMHGAIREN